jgi:hypothetical protein
VWASAAHAAPEAHLLRIDPRASLEDGAPLLTTVVELVQHKRMSSITSKCAQLTGNQNFDCLANAIEKPQALYAPFKFPEKNALLTVTVDGADRPATLVSADRWGKSKSQEGVGTAWLILIDAVSSMGARFNDAKLVARAFIDQMGPNDIVDVMFFNSRAVARDSKWSADKGVIRNFIDSQNATFAKQGRTRPLFNIIKQGTTDAFRELGNAGSSLKVPMHQALVVLSNGSSGSDVGSAATTAIGLRDYLTGGRFPEDNETLPKTPMPVVSIWFPSRETEEFFQNARQFMENLANPEIGGFHSIVRSGGARRGPKIARAVNTRFDQMHLIKWRVACVAPTINQTFKLFFKNTNPPITGDNFINVPVGIDPAAWPLDVDLPTTLQLAKKDPIYPGGTIKVFGNFCWGADSNRAEIYMVPKNQPAPASLKDSSIEDAKKAQQTLIAANMRGKATAAGDTFAEFDLPDTEKFLAGKGDKRSARLIVYDSRAKRTSAITADKIVTVPAREAPFPWLWVAGGSFAGLVVLLLFISTLRAGRAKRRSSSAGAPPRPVVAGGPIPGAIPGTGAHGPGPMPGGAVHGAAPPHGYGAPPQAGGMAAPYAPMHAATAPTPPAFGAPQQVAAAPGSAFSGADAPTAAAPPAPAQVRQATLRGTPGIYPVHPGREVRLGRDPAVAEICLTEPRVSGLHSTLKLDNNTLYVRDEGSNNGTFVNGTKVHSHTWTSVPNGAMIQFGPIEFSVRLE